MCGCGGGSAADEGGVGERLGVAAQALLLRELVDGWGGGAAGAAAAAAGGGGGGGEEWAGVLMGVIGRVGKEGRVVV